MGPNGPQWTQLPDVMGGCIVLEGVKDSWTDPQQYILQLKLPAPGEGPGCSYLNWSEHKPSRCCVLGISPHHVFGSSPTTRWSQSATTTLTKKHENCNNQVSLWGLQVTFQLFSFLPIFLSSIFTLLYCHITIHNNNKNGCFTMQPNGSTINSTCVY